MSNSNKRTTHVVVHPSFYFRVNGKIQQLEVGSKLTLTPAQAEGPEDKGFIRKVSKKGPKQPDRSGPDVRADGK